MESRYRLIIAIGIVVVAIILGLVGYFGWLNITRVDTLKAQVDGRLVPVKSAGTAQVVELALELGDAVVEGEQIALMRMRDAQGPVLLPVFAPISGIVAARSAHVGETVAAGAALYLLSDPEQVWITAEVHPNRVPQVRVGQLVRVRLFTRTKRWIFWGRVQQIGVASGAALGTGTAAGIGMAASSDVPVAISVDTGEYPLLPGMRAEVRIRLDPRPSLW